MISLIIFFIGVAVTYILSFLTLQSTLNWWDIIWIVIVAIVGMIIINGIVATICSKLLPKKCFNAESKFYNVSKKERKFYEKLGVKNWKDKTLEMGFLNGFRKNKLNDPTNPSYVERFILENNKAYLTHFVSVIASVGAIFILPIKLWLPMGLPISITSIILNVIPIIILRYNVPRLKILLKYSERNKK